MKNKKVVLIGTAILFAAVAIVLAAVLLPATMSKRDMNKILRSVPQATRVSVGAPHFDTGDVLGNKGKEILLEGDALASVQAEILALTESGYRYGGEEKGLAGGKDVNVKIRTAEGDVFYVWFSESRFYYTENGRCIFFDPEDREAYRALYEKLNALLQ